MRDSTVYFGVAVFGFALNALLGEQNQVRKRERMRVGGAEGRAGVPARHGVHVRRF